MGQPVAQSLVWVNRELASTLNDARIALEEYIERPEQSAALKRSAELLHQAHGALRMAEVYGASLLAEEMELLVRHLVEQASRGHQQDEGLEALSRAILQLPTYMDRVVTGGRDIPLVLLPLLNDLRAARGTPLLSENTLLLLNLPSDRQLVVRGARPKASGEDILSLARKLRPRYQAALLAWIRGVRPDSSLAVIADVAERLEHASAEMPVYQVWWVLGGVVEALRQGGLPVSASVKRLLGQVDRQIRRLIDEGEAGIAAAPPVELLNSLLFYVARSGTRGSRVSAIRGAFSLGDLLPDQGELEDVRDSLSGPSVKLMRTVADAIREDLGKVKDILDVYARTGAPPEGGLAPQLDLLKKIGDTLGVLGLGEVRADVQAEASRLQTVLSGETVANEETLLSIAASLLKVEDHLDERLLRQVVQEPEVEAPENEELSAVTAAVLRECLINMARVRDAISERLTGPLEPQLVDSVPELLKGVTAGLLVLERPRAVAVLERIGVIVRRVLEPSDADLPRDALDRLADAIVSLEYFMETIQGGRRDPDFMLENAEACLDAVATLGAVVPEFEPMEGALTDTVGLRPRAESQPPAPEPAPVFAGEDRADPELLELFIEEARELSDAIAGHFPAWREDANRVDDLAVARRSFHTLKGSGRMVGARLIGEFAWSVENLMNGLLDGRVVRRDSVVRFLDRAVQLMPALIEQLETGRQPETDIEAYIAQAHAFAEGRPEAEATLDATLAGIAPAAEEAAEPPGEEMDPVLRDIFTREAAGHLEVLEAFVADCRKRTSPYAVTEAAHRASHTLAGSANMAGVAAVVEVVRPLNEYLRRLFDDHAGLPEEGLNLVEQATSTVGEVVVALRDGAFPPQPESDLPRRIRTLHEDYQLRAEAGAAPAPAPEEAAPDAEILALFSEEATEILEEAQRAMAQWRSEPHSAEPVRALQRQLHTLKGGARLTGIPAMGDLSHQLESLFESLVEGRRAPDSGLIDLVQACLDTLHAMRDQLLDGGRPLAPAALVSRLSSALTGEPAEPAEPTEPFEPEPEFPAETTDSTRAPEPEGTAAADLPMEPAHPPREAEAPPAGAAEEGRPPAVEVPPAAPEIPPPEPVEPEAEPPETEIEYLGAAGTGEPSIAWSEPVPPRDVPPPEAPPSEEASREEAPPVEAGREEAASEEAQPEEPGLAAAGERAATDAVWPPQEEAAATEAMETPISDAADAAAEAREPEPEPEPVPAEVVKPAPAPVVPSGPPRLELARVDAELLENLLNNAGEVGIFRARLEEQLGSIEFNLDELSQTVIRLRDQLRKLEIETEAQILHRHQGEIGARGDFDPLEMDRYSTIQQLSRALAETASDVASIQDLLEERAREAETLLVQQSRAISELQDGLMRTRMTPFNRHVQRLSRLVRQAAAEYGRRAELQVEGGTTELDRQVMERMLGPLEHLVRNAVIHGIESPDARRSRDKPETGRVTVGLRREGAEVVVEVSDDGAGLDADAIRLKAEAQGLIAPGASLSDSQAAALILRPGFSTARELTQAAGRGVGMDVVASEVRQLGGALQVHNRPGEGARFEVRLPFTRAITQALIVRSGDEWYALPLPAVEGVVRVPAAELPRYVGAEGRPFRYGETDYRFEHIGALVEGHAANLPETGAVPAILVRAGERPTALLTDEMLGSREIVVKALGPQLSGTRGLAGATILGDGRIVLILDIAALIRSRARQAQAATPPPLAPKEDHRTFVMVVDDSITVRRVTERLLERNGMRVVTAKDGVDAVAALQDQVPDVILLDIEMPRMDGYEVATHVRNDPRLRHVPIVMITSRVGDKHRSRAMDIGVDQYLGKPYQESDLLSAIESLVRARQEAGRHG